MFVSFLFSISKLESYKQNKFGCTTLVVYMGDLDSKICNRWFSPIFPCRIEKNKFDWWFNFRHWLLPPFPHAASTSNDFIDFMNGQLYALTFTSISPCPHWFHIHWLLPSFPRATSTSNNLHTIFINYDKTKLSLFFKLVFKLFIPT